MRRTIATLSLMLMMVSCIGASQPTTAPTEAPLPFGRRTATQSPAPQPASASAPAAAAGQLQFDTFFPMGFMAVYAADQAQAFPRIAAGGFNVVHEFRGIQDSGMAESYLSQAEAAGLHVIQNLPGCRAYAAPDPSCQQYNAGLWSEQEWAAFISTLATHDNLAAWYLPDEIKDYRAAARLYTWIKT